MKTQLNLSTVIYFNEDTANWHLNAFANTNITEHKLEKVECSSYMAAVIRLAAWLETL